MDKKTFNTILIASSILLLVGGIVVFFVGVLAIQAALTKAVTIICGIILILISALVAYYMYLNLDIKKNYFLTDGFTGITSSPEKLTFETVNKKLNGYISGIAENDAALWNGTALTEDNFGKNKEFEIPIAYKMLFDLADFNSDEYWQMFTGASPDAIAFICAAVTANGDDMLSSAVRKLRSIFEETGSDKKIREYITSNRKFLGSRMYSYVKKNISLFNEEK